MKVTYNVYAHSSSESAWDAFELACKSIDYVPSGDELSQAKYIGMEIKLQVEFDTESKQFRVSMGTT